jgi:acetoacetyl-CoA reductase
MVRAVAPDVLQKIIAKIPVGRLGKVEEIAGAVCYLASDEAAFVTGSTLTINGGQYIT